MIKNPCVHPLYIRIFGKMIIIGTQYGVLKWIFMVKCWIINNFFVNFAMENEMTYVSQKT